MTPQPPLPQSQDAICPSCKSAITFVVPDPFCINHLTFSQITIVHERGLDCPACGAYFVLGIAGAHVDYVLSPAERPQRPSGLVVPVLQFPKKLVGGN